MIQVVCQFINNAQKFASNHLFLVSLSSQEKMQIFTNTSINTPREMTSHNVVEKMEQKERKKNNG